MKYAKTFASVFALSLLTSAIAQTEYDNRLSDMLGHSINNPQGEEIGQVDDLLVSDNNEITHVVISVGGFLGIGDKLITVPYDELQVSEASDDELNIVYSSSKEQLEQQQAFNYREGEMTWHERQRQMLQDMQAKAEDTGKPTEQTTAQTTGTMTQDANQEAIDIATWDQEKLYSGWSVDDLLGMEVRDSSGEAMGDIENVFVNTDEKISEIVVEAGGFLDIGDTHFSVSWDQVTLDPNKEYVQVPISKDSYDEFSLFDDDENVTTGPREWRVTELIGDYVRLQGDVRYGIVEDLIFDNDGSIQAVIVNPAVAYGTRGYYAYPYYGYQYGYNPGLNTYDLPYGSSDIENLKPFDYSKIRKEKDNS